MVIRHLNTFLTMLNNSSIQYELTIQIFTQASTSSPPHPIEVSKNAFSHYHHHTIIIQYPQWYQILLHHEGNGQTYTTTYL